jgi:hypothetical protein
MQKFQSEILDDAHDAKLFYYKHGMLHLSCCIAVVDDVLQWSLAHHCDFMVIEVMP